MTITTTSNRVVLPGNGVATSFAFSFVGDSASDIEVIYTDTSGNETTVTQGSGATQCQVTLTAAVPGQVWGLGGTVAYNPNGIPIAVGTTLTIARILDYTQEITLQNQGPYFPSAVEQMGDILEMQIQQVADDVTRVIQGPVSDATTLTYVLPAAASRANQALIFDSSGNVATSSILPSGTVSSVMAPVVNAASLSAARTALGLGNMAVENIGRALVDVSGNVGVDTQTSAIIVSTAVTSANYLQQLKVTGPITLTLPRANTLFNGFGFWLENLIPGGNLTIAIDSNDKIENGSTGVSFILLAGTSCFVSTNAASSGTWWLGGVSRGFTASTGLPGLTGLSLTVTAGSVGTNTVSCAAAYATVTDGTYFYTATAPSGTVNLNNANGLLALDTGSIASSQEYHIWCLFNPVTRASSWIASLQSTANATFLSNLPSGYTCYARAGAVVTSTASAALHGTLQKGRRVTYLRGTGQTSTLRAISANTNVGNPATGAATAFQVTGAGFVAPSTAVSVFVMGTVVNTTSGILLVAPNNGYGGSTSTSNPPPMQVGGSTSGSNQQNVTQEFVLESNSIYYASSAAAQGGIYATGWIDSVNCT